MVDLCKQNLREIDLFWVPFYDGVVVYFDQVRVCAQAHKHS